MIAWIGVGFALISSILFSCAAICLRREREKEEAVNMQYLMPGTYRILISGNFFRALRTCAGEFMQITNFAFKSQNRTSYREKKLSRSGRTSCRFCPSVSFLLFY